MNTKKNKKALLFIAMACIVASIFCILIIYYMHKEKPISEQEFQLAESVISSIDTVVTPYINEDGYTESEQVQSMLVTIDSHLEQYKADGIVKKCVIGDSSMSIRFDSGITYIYTPNVQDTLEGNTAATITTIEAFNLWDSTMSWTSHGSAALDALINDFTYGLSLDDNAKLITSANTDYSHDETINKAEFTINKIKDLKPYNILILEGHGLWHPEFSCCCIPTGEVVSTEKSTKVYSKELANDEIVISSGPLQPDTYAVTPSFLSKHLKNNENSFVYLSLCHSLQNKALADVFMNKGAFAVVGYDNTVDIAYAKLTRSYFFAYATMKNEESPFLTVSEACDSVKTLFSAYTCKSPGRITAYYNNDLKGSTRTIFNTTNTPVDESATNTDINIILSAENSVSPALSPEEAVDIYLNAYSQWKADLDGVSANCYYYGFLDLDFDGVLEMVTTVNMGTGLYSHNKYYRIDPASKAVKEITNNEKKSDGGGFDLSGSTALYKNNQSGELTYYSQDAVRGGGINYGPLWYENNAVYSEWPVGRSSERVQTAQNTYDYVYTYYLDNDVISEAEYNTLVANFEKENTNLNLQWEPCNGSEFDNATSSQRKQLLLKAYNSFHYDGFSLDDIKSQSSALKTASQEDFNNFVEYQKTLTLTDEIANKLWFTANDIYCNWTYWRERNGYIDIKNPIYLPRGNEDWPYYPVTNLDINSIADLKLLLADYFDEDIIEDIIWGYIDHNNNLYAPALAIGGDFGQIISVSVKNQNNTSAIITINGFDEMSKDNYSLEQTLEYINGKWIFTDLFMRDY